MITPNTDSTFIQVKSDNPRTLVWQDGTVAEVIEMTTQLRPAEKSGASACMKRDDDVCKGMGMLDDLLLKAVDETLKQVFREEGTEVIYNFIENKCHLRRRKFAEKTEDFSAGLERLLGSAASVIEKMILKDLYSKLELKLEEKDGYEFSDYIKELRERCGP